MDIEDILREVDSAASRGGVALETRDLQSLTRLWVAERSAPELLKWPSDRLFERVNDRIRSQVERVEEMTGDMDPKTNFSLIVMQTELERYKYLMRSYLRTRIAKVSQPLSPPISSIWPSSSCADTISLLPLTKIDKHTLHYLSSPELRTRLSSSELAYATRHQALLHNHYLSSFMSSFPEQLQNLNDSGGGNDMIDSPDLDTAVFIRMLRDRDVYGRGTDADVTLPAEVGDILILRWSNATELVEDGDAELV